MASFEEEALRRAKQMHSRPYQYERETKPTPQEKKVENAPKESESITETQPKIAQKNLVDFLLADKEQSLILLLLLLLSGEKADPSLLLALMYLLM